MIEYDTKVINAITAKSIQNARTITINYKKYIRVCMGYDTETTRINKKSYVYHFAVSLNKLVFGFRSWESFLSWIDMLNKTLDRKYRNTQYKPLLIIWVANLSFEFQFLKDRLQWKVFATASRQPLTATYGKYIQLREALKISGGGLAYLAKNYCKTQKMVGDLDYTKERNSTTELNEKELKYIENDVVILSEFADYIFNNAPAWGTMPYTATGILRAECKRLAKKDTAYLNDIQQAYFTEKEYDVYMQYLSRGGFTHANRAYTNRLLTDVESWDKKSSYPSKTLQEYFPADKFKRVSFKPELLEKYCCILDIEFTNIRATTTHSIESAHKCVAYNKAYWDNGRLMQAESLRVLLTELDYKIYKLFYKWDSIMIISCKIAHRRTFPFFMRELILKYFDIKEHTPKDTPEYMESKKHINAFYGMCITKHHKTEDSYINGEWVQQPATNKKGNIKTFNDFIKEDFLLPAWGIWITSHARTDLLLQVWENQKFVVYCDTDSIYFAKGYDKSKILAYNEHLQKINRQGIQRNYDKIGCYEFEGRYRRFKTLGAKRYVKEYYLKDLKQHRYKIIQIIPKHTSKLHKSYYISLHRHTQTIAGLGKTALIEYCNKKHKDIFDVFKPDMLLMSVYTQKLTTHYEDKPHSDIVNGELMQELSSVSLMPSDFKLHITREYLNLIMKERLKRK